MRYALRCLWLAALVCLLELVINGIFTSAYTFVRVALEGRFLEVEQVVRNVYLTIFFRIVLLQAAVQLLCGWAAIYFKWWGSFLRVAMVATAAGGVWLLLASLANGAYPNGVTLADVAMFAMYVAGFVLSWWILDRRLGLRV